MDKGERIPYIGTTADPGRDARRKDMIHKIKLEHHPRLRPWSEIPVATVLFVATMTVAVAVGPYLYALADLLVPWPR